ncbi:TPA: catecholate siderophore esterase IroE, partial [Escherichia coli]
TTSFDSVDGTRHYRVWTAVPNTTAPASGYPILYMLDGNAVMDRLDDELLKQLSEKTPPVIVAVGYQTNLPFDLNSRAYDYTPAAESRKTDLHSGRFSRKSGGSNNFRQLLETRIAPKVEQGLNIDRQRRGLWGHSYGGLFVLDSWLSSS